MQFKCIKKTNIENLNFYIYYLIIKLNNFNILLITKFIILCIKFKVF